MFRNERALRSTATAITPTIAYSPDTSPLSFTSPSSTHPSSSAAIQIVLPGSKLPGLTSAELKLLRAKQRQLALNASATLQSLPAGGHIRNALNASLIFAQHEAGSAVCIDAAGWILTCAHCFGDTEEEWRAEPHRWLLFYTGLAIQVKCAVWNPKNDLALAKIITIESSDGKNGRIPDFCFVPLSTKALSFRMPIVCIGQPGKDDLESTTKRRTKYNLVEVSEGIFHGMVANSDPHDNSLIGSLKHDAWTYWGHSGAPLLRKVDGTLIGLHSSWDDQTAMRHGIPLIAINHFLQRHLHQQSTGTIDSPINVD